MNMTLGGEDRAMHCYATEWLMFKLQLAIKTRHSNLSGRRDSVVPFASPEMPVACRTCRMRTQMPATISAGERRFEVIGAEG